MSAELGHLAADPTRVSAVDRADLPDLIGESAALHARLVAALHAAPVEAVARPARNGDGDGEPDTLLTADEAAERLGVSRRWVYRRAESLPFTRRLGAGTLRFSARGLERWKESRP